MLPTVRSILHYPTTPSFRADTQAWLGVATGNYSTAERQALDALLGGLAADGILSFDRLYLLQFGDNEADSLRCVVSLGSASTEGSTPPTFVRRQGWQGNTVNGSINTGWAPSSGVNFQQSSCSVGCYVRRVSTVTSTLRFLLGCSGGSSSFIVSIGVGVNNTDTLYRVNSGLNTQNLSTVVPTDSSYCSINRSTGTVAIARKDSIELNTNVNSTGRTTTPLRLLARTVGLSIDGRANHELAMAHAGAAQTTAQNTSFRSRMDTFHTAIGFS